MKFIDKNWFNNPNTIMKRFLPFFAVIALVSGCSLFGTNPSAPTATEGHFYDIVTQYVQVPMVINKTNYIDQVNPVVVLSTNTFGMPYNVTNFQTNLVPVFSNVTNLVNQTNYTFSTSDSTKSTISAIGTGVNMAAPGFGGLVGAGLTALVGLWGYLRSYKPAVNTNSALVQEIQTIRQFVQALPNGDVYDAAVTKFLSDHQNDAGVATTVASLLESEISNGDAKVAASQVIATIQALYAQKAGVAAAAVAPTSTAVPLAPMAVKL